MSYRNLAAAALAAALTLVLLAGPLASPAWAGTEERVQTPSVIDTAVAWIVEALGFSADASEKGGTFVIPGGQPTDSDASPDGDTLTSDDSDPSADTEGGAFVSPGG